MASRLVVFTSTLNDIDLFLQNSVGLCHLKMHELVAKDTSTFLEKNEALQEFFKRLIGCGKQLFLITNSPYRFV